MLSTAGSAWAAEIQFSPIISISETYTDNVTLAPRGLESSDWVTKVSAGFSLGAVGRRARFNIRYTPSLYSFARQNELDLRQQLASSGRVDLVEEHFSVNGSAVISEEFTGSNDDISVSDRNLSSDRYPVLSYSVTPELRNRFGSVATARLNYSYRRVDSRRPSEDSDVFTLSDADTHGVDLQVSSGVDFQKIRWNASANWRKQNRGAGVDDTENRSVRLDLTYNFNRAVGLVGGVGYRDFSFTSATSDRQGLTWDAGVRLTPSPRTSLRVTYGDEADNKRWTVSGRYQPTPRTGLTVSYNENYRTVQDIILDDLPSVDDPATPTPTPTPSPAPGLGGAFDFFDPNDIPGNITTDQVFLQKRFSASISHTISRTTVSLSGYRDERSYADATGDTALGSTVSLSHTFSRLVSLSSFLSYTDRDDLSDRQDEIYTGSVYLRRRLVGSASAFVSYDYTRRDSTDPLFDLRENAVSVGFTASF